MKNNPAAAAERGRQINEKLRQIQRENPELSYTAAFNQCREALPEIFAAMATPAAANAPGRNAEQAKAGAVFSGKVQAAMHARGATFDQAWNAMRLEEPELFQAMAGNDDPRRVYETVTDDPAIARRLTETFTLGPVQS